MSQCAAVVAMKWNPIVAEFCDRLTKRGKPPMKIVGESLHSISALQSLPTISVGNTHETIAVVTALGWCGQLTIVSLARNSPADPTARIGDIPGPAGN